jgi:hypothetical protein
MLMMTIVFENQFNEEQTRDFEFIATGAFDYQRVRVRMEGPIRPIGMPKLEAKEPVPPGIAEGAISGLSDSTQRLHTDCEPRQSNPASGRGPGEIGHHMGKGDIRLLQKGDGSLYESVEFPKAARYTGISDRRRQQLMRDRILVVTGKGRHRRITVESLIAYCPPAEEAK